MEKKWSLPELWPGLAEFTWQNLISSETGWIVEGEGKSEAVCPGCGTVSQSRHSRYWRRVKDLPVQGTSVLLKLKLSRWRCRNTECERHIFTERVPPVLVPYARQTNRLSEAGTLVSHSLGGRPGERLLRRLGMPMSRHTLLRRIKRAARNVVSGKAVEVLGVDDWAWKKGTTFGTILVDLERSQVIDVLPERSALALSTWLAQHPEVKVISRDRQGVYAEGARRGAPDALQVADRFHLVLNLRQAVERALAVQRPHLCLPAPSAPVPPSTDSVKDGRGGLFRTRSRVQQQALEAAQQRRQQQLALFAEIKGMKAAGLKVSQIATQLGLHRRRIDRWVRHDVLPERNRMAPRPGLAESFRDYLRQRWEAGVRHGRTLFAEIRERGYRGSFSHLAKLLSPWRQPIESVLPSAEEGRLKRVAGQPAGHQVSPPVAAALLMKSPAELSAQQAEIVKALQQQCPEFAVMRRLALSFRALLRHGKRTTLHRWMQRAENTGIHALQRFVRTLQQDLRPVEAAIQQPWSNGPVEGHINRLKLLKRQMYGRAGVELLRARLLPEPVFANLKPLHQK